MKCRVKVLGRPGRHGLLLMDLIDTVSLQGQTALVNTVTARV